MVKDLRESRGTERSTEHPPLVFGVDLVFVGETALWYTAAKKAEKWCRGSLKQPNGSR